MEEEVNTKVNTDVLRSVSDEGYIRFSIKAYDTIENKAVHTAFKQFSKIECDDNYTQGLRKLLEYFEGDFKYAMLSERINVLETKIEELKKQPEETDSPGAF